MNTLSLGEKIRNYRKRTGYSQLQLETEINAANGSISRIEGGKVNPTKETLASIANALKLSPEERLSLYSLDLGDPTAGDTVKAKDQVAEYFSLPTTFALLLDNRWNIIDVSKGFLDIFEQLVPSVEAILQSHLLEMVYDEKLGISQFIDNWQDFILDELALFRLSQSTHTAEDWYQNLIKKLEQLPLFQEHWQKSRQIAEPFLSQDSRHIRLKVGNQEIKMLTHFRHLNFDPRFELLDYTIETDHAE